MQSNSKPDSAKRSSRSSKDPWYYQRSELATQVLSMFESGLSSALVFFAPRRMGKTEFLRKDIEPLASKRDWQVLYFSFLDVGLNAHEKFLQALTQLSNETGALKKFQKKSPQKLQDWTKKIKKVELAAGGVGGSLELQPQNISTPDMKTIMTILAEHRPTLLLLDEIQTLAKDKKNEAFIAELRTALDINKDAVKVIFTGSSREGLRRMFSQATAPFFHFGQNLAFPELDKKFTDHMANMFKKVTQRTISPETLWKTFQAIGKVPQLMRALVERLALNPNLTVAQAEKQLMADIFSDRAFAETLDNCSTLEILLLREIAKNSTALYSKETRHRYAQQLGVERLSVAAIQSALRSLQNKQLIGPLETHGSYFIDDPNFKNWLIETDHGL